ncbi:MAG: hypothetical protein WD360_07915 [Nitriliruptoraceae bacterium]
MSPHDSAKDEAHDPFAPIEASPRFAHAYAAIAALLGVVSIVGLIAPFAGPIGMALGLVAHVKGSRFGMPSTVVAAVGMIIGMSLTMYLR